MRKAGRLSSIEYYSIFPLLSSWGVRSSSFFRSARSPNSRGRLSLNLTTGPATKHQKGKPGKGSPRLEKIKKRKVESGRGVDGGRWLGILSHLTDWKVVLGGVGRK